MKKLALGVLAAGFAVTAACSSTPTKAAGTVDQTTVTTVLTTTTRASTGTTTTTVAGSSSLAIGRLNPNVTQATIRTTICVAGWTATVRPPTSFTDPLKVAQLATLGYADQNPADYEEDHIIPLELGGAPHDANNLRPELWPDAHTKDAQENRLHDAVCSGTMTLDAGRSEMAAYAVRETPALSGGATSPAVPTTTRSTSPATSTTVTTQPAGQGSATALCKDGSLWYNPTHQGACSRHGGVAQFYN